MIRIHLLSLLFLSLNFDLLMSASPLRVVIRETANLKRKDEPVIIKGEMLIREWGKNIPVNKIKIKGSRGSERIQIDEKDGGEAYVRKGNGVIDANDEIVWLVSMPALGTKNYVVSIEGSVQPKAKVKSYLFVEENMEATSSATWVMENDWINVGLRGWKKNPQKHRGYGKGLITHLRVEGHDVINQNESLGFTFDRDPKDQRDATFNKIEVVAQGPIRAIVQMTGPEFTGVRRQKYDQMWMEVEKAKFTRAYYLYDGIPWLSCRESIRAKKFNSKFISGFKFGWRPGGTPFHPQTKMWIPDQKGGVASNDINDKGYVNHMNFPGETWLVATRPDKRMVQALFFEPSKTRFFKGKPTPHSDVIKSRLKLAGKIGRFTAEAEVRYSDLEISSKQRFDYGWGMWCDKSQDPMHYQRKYRAMMMRPLSKTLQVLGSKGQDRYSRAALKAKARPLQQRLDRTEKQIAAAAKMSSKADKRSLDQLLKALKKREASIRSDLNVIMGRWDTMNNQKKQDWLEKLEGKLAENSSKLLRDQQVELLMKQGMGKGYAVYTSDNFAKNFSNLRCPGKLNGAMSLTAARGEGESLQVGLVPLLQNLEQVEVRVEGLKNAQGKEIPASAWSRYRVGDIPVTDEHMNRHRGKPVGTRWPDALIPVERIDCASDMTQGVVMTLQVPVDTVPGKYRGEIVIHPKGLAPTRLPLNLRVYKLTLPERRTLKWDTWYSLDTSVRYYTGGLEDEGIAKVVTLERFEKNMKMLAKYRSVGGFYAWIPLLRNFRVYVNKDREFEFDFSWMDPYIEICQKYGNLWNPNLNGAGFNMIFNSVDFKYVVRQKGGSRRYKKRDFPQRSKINPKFTLLYEKFMIAYVAHLKKKGWLEDAYLEPYDEPSGKRLDEMIELHDYLRKIVPDLKLMAWGLSPTHGKKAIGHTDVWAPTLRHWVKSYDALQKRRKAGDKLMMYTCQVGAGRELNPKKIVPHINLLYSNAQRRLYGWLYHLLDLDGMFIFTMNGWTNQREEVAPPAPKKVAKVAKPVDELELEEPEEEEVVSSVVKKPKAPNVFWPKKDFKARKLVKKRFMRTQWLVYPAPNGDLWPSLRLDALRDGFEDYEYIHAAKELLKKKNIPELKRLLNVDDIISKDYTEYSLEFADYQKRRDAIAEVLDKHL